MITRPVDNVACLQQWSLYSCIRLILVMDYVRPNKKRNGNLAIFCCGQGFFEFLPERSHQVGVAYFETNKWRRAGILQHFQGTFGGK
jgi:hypothetical protein